MAPAYIVALDHGLYAGPYASYAAANHAADRSTLQAWFIADASGLPHPDMDPSVAADVVEDFAPFTPITQLRRIDL